MVNRVAAHNRDVWCIVLILILAAILRFCSLGTKSLWGDEFHSLIIAAGHLQSGSHHVAYPPSGVIKALGDDTDVPFYFMLLNLWIRVFGNSAAALRALSVLFEIAAVWVLYRIARALFPEHGNYVSAFIMAMAPLHVYYAQEARAYALVVFLTLSSTYFFVALVFDDRRRLWLWIGYGLSAVLAILSHYFAMLIYFTQNLFLLLCDRRLFFSWRWMMSQALLGAVWLWAFLTLFHVPSLNWIHTSAPYDAYWPYIVLPLTLSKFTFADYAMEVFHLFRPALWVGIPFFGLLFLLGVIALERRQESKKLLFLLMWLFVPVLTLTTVDWWEKTRSAMVSRYILAASPAYYLLLSTGLASITNKYFRAVALAAVTSLLSLALFQYYQEPKLEQWKEIAQHIDQADPAADLVVYYPGDWNFLPYYIRRPVPELGIEYGGAAAIEEVSNDVRVIFLLIRTAPHLANEEDLAQIHRLLDVRFRLDQTLYWRGLKLLKYMPRAHKETSESGTSADEEGSK